MWKCLPLAATLRPIQDVGATTEISSRNPECYDRFVTTFYVENFGCRATQADGAALERQFEARGFRRSGVIRADLVVLNTCTVTRSADQDARAAIRRVRRNNPEAKIVVTGCYAQRAPEEIAALPGVSAVIGNSHKHRLAELLFPARRSYPAMDGLPNNAAFVPVAALTQHQHPLIDDSRLFVSDIFAHTELLAAPVFEWENASGNQRTRPNLKIQDGCDNRCSFCVIPSVRGHSRSLPAEKVVDEVNMLVAAGYKELVVSGINLGRWGRDIRSDFHVAGRNSSLSTHKVRSFAHLLRFILTETNLEKLRISSVEPMDWTDDLISLLASSPRIAKHVHVPLQSGSDAVLRRMHRKYRPWHYREKIQKISSAMPGAAIGADVMVGFPGETDAEFENTRRLVQELPFTYLHVFTYSPRPRTPAAAMPNQVQPHLARERNRILRDLAAAKKHAFMLSFVGKPLDVITLNKAHESKDGNRTDALTDNYLKLSLRGRHAPNRWITAQVEGLEEDGLVGRPLESASRNS